MSIEGYYESIDYNEIKRYVDEKREEDVYLEFKRAVHINANDKTRNSDKKNFSKCISGFANSDGGIIIWGVEAKQKNGVDYASKLVPIQELKRFINRLNSLEGQAVSPVVEGIRHRIITHGGLEEDTGYVKTYIPKSIIAPHMANYANKHYYKRSGDSFYIAEHYDIADMFARNTKPLVDLIVDDIRWRWIDRLNNKVRIDIVFALENTGVVVAKFPLLSIWTNSLFTISEFGVNGNGLTGLKRQKRSNTYYNYHGENNTVLYPNLPLEVDLIRGEFSNLEMDQIPNMVISYLIAAENMEIVEGKISLSGAELLKPEYHLPF